MSSNPSTEQLPTIELGNSVPLSNDLRMFEVYGTNKTENSSAVSILDLSLSQSSLESNHSSFFAERTVSSYSNTSLNTTPPLTPPEDPKSKTCYLTDENHEPLTASALYAYFRKNVPSFQVNSVSCPAPPISSRPRPLTKKDLKHEATFHSKIKSIYWQAACYEERIAEDPSAHAFLGEELSMLKKDLWEYHMREICPAPPAPMSELFDNTKQAWKAGEPAQVCVGFFIMFLTFWLPFMLSPETYIQ